ncbi:hypothetical protein BUALT_Bualt02G0130600 [Buddleja alternifolia]|uniref:Uncharacterized protein n=1 Tax=Buddleja alternifolia TaxID=168488 RepID=A0AAV6YAW0_9LAMI|nr:hypothetical protein BUALT_Bualt02G0130600 [Buddleja alternifolia]
MVALNPAILTRKPNLLFRWAASARTSSSHFNTLSRAPAYNPIYVNRGVASCRGRIYPISVNGYKVFGRSEFRFEHLGIRSLRVSSGGGGGGGIGGSGNGSSGGGGGGSGGGGGGSNWSLLSWYMSLLAKYPVMTKAVTSAFLTLVGDVICQVKYLHTSL